MKGSSQITAKRWYRIGVSWVCLMAGGLHGAETRVLEFSEEWGLAETDQVGVNAYEEGGFTVKPLGAIASETPFRLRLNGGAVPGYVANGGPFLQLALTDSMEIFANDGQLFSPLRVDLGEYALNAGGVPEVVFIGHLADGSWMEVSFLLDGLADGVGGIADFQTFEFPGTFSELTRLVAGSTFFSMDNLEVSVIPEPGASTLLAVLVVLLVAMNRIRQLKQRR